MALSKSDNSSNELARWIKFWNVTDGRDKISKVLQYSSRGFAWAVSDANKNTQFKLLALSQSCADARKIFRLGKFVNEYIKIKELLSTTPSNDNNEAFGHLMNLGCRASYFAYWVFDALFILTKIKVLQGDTKRHSDKSFLFWFFGIIFSLIYNLHNLRLVVLREHQLRSQEISSKVTEELDRIHTKRKTYYLNLIRDFGDLITSSNGIRIPHRVIGRGFSDGLIGLGGTISALIVCYQQYPARR